MHYLLRDFELDHTAGGEEALMGVARSQSVKATTRRSQPTPEGRAAKATGSDNWRQRAMRCSRRVDSAIVSQRGNREV